MVGTDPQDAAMPAQRVIARSRQHGERALPASKAGIDDVTGCRIGPRAGRRGRKADLPGPAAVPEAVASLVEIRLPQSGIMRMVIPAH